MIHRFLVWASLALFCAPLAAQPVTVAPVNPVLGTAPSLVVNPISLPQGFLQPETLRYSLWATHQTRRRLDLFRSRFPQLSDARVDIAISAAVDLENALKETLKSAAQTGTNGDVRAAVSAERLDAVRKSLAFFEASASAPEVKTLLDQPLPELGEERARTSLRQLSRLVANQDAGWPNSPTPSPAARTDLRAPSVTDETTPLRPPHQMELVWANMPESLAAVARKEYNRAYQEAYYDGVTGIHARRYLDHHAAEFAEKEDVQIVGDIDHFKKVNDDMGGHQIGDATLKAVASIWGEELVKVDGVGVRWGGEEFWGGVPGGDREKAVAVAAAINARVRAEVHKKIGLPRPLTISIGVAGVEPKALGTKLEAFHETFKRADDAVFHAKHSGRDRVVLQAAEQFAIRYAPPAPSPETAKKGALAFLGGVAASLAAFVSRRRK